MSKKDLGKISDEVERKYLKKDIKRKKKMKVSGSGVKRLGRIISDQE